MSEAIQTAIDVAPAKFDETLELHVKLGVDSRKADQQVRGVVVLPNGTGKTVRVLVIAKGAKADEARRRRRFRRSRRVYRKDAKGKLVRF